MDSIWRSDLDGLDARVLLNGLNSAGDLLVDEDEAKIYWSENNQIGRANVDGSEVETVLSELSYPRLLALDSVALRIYWSTSTSGSVMNGLYSSNLDGIGNTPLVVNQTVNPTSVLLGVIPGKIFWANQSEVAAIYRANTDGSDVEQVVGDLPGSPNELTYDRRSGKLFWVYPSDAVDRAAGLLMSANVDGSEVAMIADGVGWAFGLSIDRTFPNFPVRPNAKP